MPTPKSAEQQASYPPLSEAQQRKLRQLSVVSAVAGRRVRTDGQGRERGEREEGGECSDEGTDREECTGTGRSEV